MIEKEEKINFNRLKTDILSLSEIGKNKKDRGIYRMAFSEHDMQARGWLREQILNADLKFQIDGAANISAILEGQENKPKIIVGSHIDTVPCAGALDGTLGVLIGLECLRRFKELGIKPVHGIELVSFTDEEGRFGGMFGSQSFCGRTTPETLHSSRDLNGISLSEALKANGFEPIKALEAARNPTTIKNYLELHIEQGPVLDNLNKQIGVVTEITGLFKWSVKLLGVANHAGTTPMEMRKDAFMGLAEFANEIPRIIEENGSEKSRATIGKVDLHPGAANSVPGMVEFSLDVRDTSVEILNELQEAFRKAISAIARRRELMFEFETLSWINPVKCAEDVMKVIEGNAKKLALDYLLLPSGAAHDAQILGEFVPSAMIFVPSKNGLSHSPSEWTAWSDIEAGANLMFHTILELSR
ncbi:Zn-dependent hydrolase [Flexithrix dorotheae]|uniref:Zn-dependent hydrolase n=1 Tax=Flexithrix dorotheae TaxID=70993 RepID=UPI0003811A04|nr:Zn-dependent hydrolase [Flexithrix dorotheae]